MHQFLGMWCQGGALTRNRCGAIVVRMPSVNVRLSDQLHADLVARAQASGRSLQQQIIVTLDGREPVRGLGAGGVARAAVASPSDAAAASLAPSPVRRNVTPDFKKGAKK